MTSTNGAGPLYIFVKPPAEKLIELRRLRAMFGIESGYALGRVHSTFLPLGEATRTNVDIAHTILDSFRAEPFDIAFDHIRGSALQPRKGQRAPRALHHALVRHLTLSGFTPPPYKFDLHLNLDYGTPSDRRASIPPLVWTADEILLIKSINREHIPHGRFPLFARQYALAL